MNFREYKWFNNPRGLRNNGPYTALDADHYTNPRMGWAKLVVGGTEHVDEVGRLLGHGCMPIVQIYRERMGAAPADEAWFDVYAQYVKAGALWFELYDEPNLPAFWPAGRDGRPDPDPDWHDVDRCVGPLMDGWLDWAERIAAMGAYPAFPALAETTVPELATVSWYDACMAYLAQRRADRFGRLMASGLWCAVHPHLLNHYYQEPPGGPPSAARPYYQQSHKEGGWHFEYPYDPLQQHDDPGRTPFGGTARTPHGDPNGLVCSGEIFTELLMKTFGAGPVPVLGTAGGITPIPGVQDDPVQPDARYQGYSRESHAEATAALFRWIAESGPPWLFGLALSSEADYYPGGKSVPAIGMLEGMEPTQKEVPDLEIRRGKSAQALVQAAMESWAEDSPPQEEPPSPFDPFAAAPMPGEAGPVPGEAGPEQPAPEAEQPSEPGEAGLPVPTEPAPAGPAPAKSEAELGDLASLDLFTQPSISTLQPMPPVDGTLKPVEPVDGTLKEVEPVDTTLKDFEPPENTLMESSKGPYGDPYAAAGVPGEPGPGAAGEPYHGPATPDVIPMPAGEEPEPEVVEEAPPTPVEPGPGAAGEPAPIEAPEEEPVATTELWPAPDVMEEAPETISPLSVGSAGPGVSPLGPGPGPYTDILSDHWLMPTPDLPPEWLFGAARRYWDAFHTPIVGDAGLIGAVPPDRSLAVTLIAPSGSAAAARQSLAAEWPNVRVDVVSGATLADLQTELDRRAREMKEFG